MPTVDTFWVLYTRYMIQTFLKGCHRGLIIGSSSKSYLKSLIVRHLEKSYQTTPTVDTFWVLYTRYMIQTFLKGCHRGLIIGSSSKSYLKSLIVRHLEKSYQTMPTVDTFWVLYTRYMIQTFLKGCHRGLIIGSSSKSYLKSLIVRHLEKSYQTMPTVDTFWVLYTRYMIQTFLKGCHRGLIALTMFSGLGQCSGSSLFEQYIGR